MYIYNNNIVMSSSISRKIKTECRLNCFPSNKQKLYINQKQFAAFDNLKKKHFSETKSICLSFSIGMQ